jgi:lipoate-protein ligase A
MKAFIKIPTKSITNLLKTNIIISKSTSIGFHLATEEYLYNHQNIEKPILFLYQNDKTIVIGRHQNPWKECNVTQMEAEKIKLVSKIH